MPNYGFMRQEMFTAEQLLILSVSHWYRLFKSIVYGLCPLKLYYYSSSYLGCRGGVCWRGGEAEEQPEGGHQGAGPSSQQLWQVQRGPGPRGCLQVRSHSHGSYLRRDPLLKNKHILDWSHCVCLLNIRSGMGRRTVDLIVVKIK